MFETARLRVRRVEPGDGDAMHAVYGDADAMRWGLRQNDDGSATQLFAWHAPLGEPP